MATAHEILSPLPGTFYRRPSPDAPPYKSEGDAVAVDEVLGLVEVMKQFSEIRAEVAGRMGPFLVEDGDPVEPGQLLATIAVA
ncbi:acetyl-CoA carboxylase [Verminephrobacter aporrectodeae]|uniref:Biotin carboxyl carrier protein of acetyl-CoA carboxylase n=1 Tax=Verminephrobacter aporrectodeae subsp. tuberculatae TaxID=1110392 RepID=A0ABT3KV27_9BURK|nr:acetyl-CoA carboxylase [Verminephrobacter aporrectodeae]MCW5222748.1 biotin carboxyl carrier domain-containing protein [Verminephrobacter aporrectodeae subsp. tuberculatae]MCW5257020.1 biotin carboxyl carrier domain-containing protein [Verminephrobacter aporrectodeae subsp. tuberculatae]MCW5288212.1 biotin carboxyl carrier domain-containing protein [Verminephrobacter aporrectodeae subsp. tuberculatae]MCW5321769.1 biotin carboxyl carrier domain-containing protein [Verminephrobacter aporrectod